MIRTVKEPGNLFQTLRTVATHRALIIKLMLDALCEIKTDTPVKEKKYNVNGSGFLPEL